MKNDFTQSENYDFFNIDFNYFNCTVQVVIRDLETLKFKFYAHLCSYCINYNQNTVPVCDQTNRRVIFMKISCCQLCHTEKAGQQHGLSENDFIHFTGSVFEKVYTNNLRNGTHRFDKGINYNLKLVLGWNLHSQNHKEQIMAVLFHVSVFVPFIAVTDLRIIRHPN